MNFLAISSNWWMFLIVGIIGLVGLVVFLLRKYVPGLVDYEDKDEDVIAEENVNRILMTTDEEDKINGKINDEDEEE